MNTAHIADEQAHAVDDTAGLRPYCTGLCHQGRKNCDCPTGAAEACTELGADAHADLSRVDRVFWAYVIAGLSIWLAVITAWLA